MGGHEQGARILERHRSEGALILGVHNEHHIQFQSERDRRPLGLLNLRVDAWITWSKKRDPRRLGYRFRDRREPLTSEGALGRNEDARHVAAGLGEGRDQSHGDRLKVTEDHDRDRGRHTLHRANGG